jgi:mono/diheme cytochrome c family protein
LSGKFDSKETIMKHRLVIGIAVCLGLLAVTPNPIQGAEDGAALYKSKCSGCHGAAGEGKPAMKAPALKATSWDADRIAQHITKGEPDAKAPHKKGIVGLNDEQAKAIADYVKSLK